MELLRSRVIGIAEPFGWLCHCLSGGLPRELVRLLRRVAEYRGTDPPLTLTGLCDVLVGKDLAIRAREFRIMAGRLAVRAPTNALMYLSNNASAKELLAATTQLVRQRATDPDRAADHLRLETAMLAYHSATLKEVFTDELDQARARDARVDNHLPGTFNQLGRVRTAITEDPRLAWLLLDEFREAWQLGIVDGRLS